MNKDYYNKINVIPLIKINDNNILIKKSLKKNNEHDIPISTNTNKILNDLKRI